MLRKIAGAWILITLSLGVAAAQGKPSSSVHLRSKALPSSIAVTYNAERAKTTFGNCNCFWFQGAAVDANWAVQGHLGLVAQLSGAHASNIGPGVDISKIDFLFGPRYTAPLPVWAHSRYRPNLFGEFLLGGVHAFDAVIPTKTGTSKSDTALGLQAGGGANVWLTRRFGIRLIEADFVYSGLPNGGNSRQYDLRLATGVTFRFP